MNKLITLGCSLTHNQGVKEKLAQLLGYELVNLSQSACGNGLQVNRFQEHVLQNKIDKNDIIIWQVTTPVRNAVRLFPNEKNYYEIKKLQDEEFTPKDRYHFVQDSFNAFDNISRLDMLCNSPWSKVYTLEYFDMLEQLQNVLSNIVLCSKIYPKTLVVFGWYEMMNEHEHNVFKNYLDMHNVNYIKEYYLDWVISKGLKMWDNDKHPDEEAGGEWSKQVLFPKLQELNWV
jgi:hypothetical protein